MTALQFALPFPATAAAQAQPMPTDRLAQRLADRPTFAFYSKTRANKDAFVDLLRERHAGRPFVYLCPKTIVAHVRARFPGFVVVALEDFTKRDVFLRLHAVVGRETVLIMENVSRYTILSSDKFNFLHRLRMATENRYLIDITPFTKAIHKLYLPLSYLERDILQYSNGWSFEYNYLEMDDAGRPRQAHDFDFLAEKLGPWCYIDYDGFLPPIQLVDSTLTAAELEAYAARKAVLFEEYDNPRKIVTEICDCANMMSSRYDSLARLLDSLEGPTVVYTNIVKNNPLIKRALKAAGCRARPRFLTYMTHPCRPIEELHVILFETPINQNQVAALDALADVRPGATAYLFRNDAKADRFIFNEVWPEWQAIDGFTRELWKHQRKHQLGG